MRKIELPQWTEGMPDHTMMGFKDIKNIFGYSQICSTNELVERGYIPEPDKKVKRGPSRRAKFLWTLGSLRRIYEDQNNDLTK